MLIEKAVAYITREDRLLVFVHPGIPEAGIQVPSGSVESDEDPSEAVVREAGEETGLDQLTLVRPLGVQELEDPIDRGQPFMRRHYFHLRAGGEVAERWRHRELHPSDGSPGPIEFEFFWVPYQDPQLELIGGMDAMLEALRADA